MTAVTTRQRQVPDPLLGRITSLNGTVAGGAEALGALADGALAAVGGIRAPMLIGALPITATVILPSVTGCYSVDDPAVDRVVDRGATVC
jgi:hypothetical protein